MKANVAVRGTVGLKVIRTQPSWWRRILGFFRRTV